MKKTYKLLLIAGIFLSLPLLSLAQTPPHPNGGGGPGGGNTPVGGGAPIDGGFTIMLIFGGIYAGKKVFKLGKEQE